MKNLDVIYNNGIFCNSLEEAAELLALPDNEQRLIRPFSKTNNVAYFDKQLDSVEFMQVHECDRQVITHTLALSMLGIKPAIKIPSLNGVSVLGLLIILLGLALFIWTDSTLTY